MVQYIGELVLHLSEALSPVNHIELKTHMASIEPDVSQAVSIGLILNEAITDACKYAFKDVQSGRNGTLCPVIAISLQTIGEAGLELDIKDNRALQSASVPCATRRKTVPAAKTRFHFQQFILPCQKYRS
jgi:two-component system, sensor histidine kinase PdtaS